MTSLTAPSKLRDVFVSKIRDVFVKPNALSTCNLPMFNFVTISKVSQRSYNFVQSNLVNSKSQNLKNYNYQFLLHTQKFMLLLTIVKIDHE